MHTELIGRSQGRQLECEGACVLLHRGFGESVKRIAKQVQGALPIVGLLSRLATPEGGIGFDELVRTKGLTSLSLSFLCLPSCIRLPGVRSCVWVQILLHAR